MSLPLLIAKLTNRPQLVHRAYASTALRVIAENKNIHITGVDGSYEPTIKPHKILKKAFFNGGHMLEMDIIDESPEPEQESEVMAGVAIVPVLGALAQRGGALQADSTVQRGYNEIKNDVYMAMQRSDIGGVALWIDGPGGEGAGCFACVESLRQMSEQFSKPIWSFIDESAFSASYAIATAGEKIITNLQGQAGSIGVVYPYVNVGKKLENDGISVEFFTFGDKKVDGNSVDPLSDTARKDINDDIDFFGNQFVDLVSNNRSITRQAVIDTQADTYTAQESLDRGLIDEIISLDVGMSQFFDYINSDGEEIHTETENEGTEMSKKTGKTDSNETETEETETSTQAVSTGTDVSFSGEEMAQRYDSIMTHPAYSNNSEIARDMAKNTALTTDQIIGYMDKLPVEASTQTDKGSGAVPKVLNQDTPQSQSILTKVMKASGSTNEDVNSVIENEETTETETGNGVNAVVGAYSNDLDAKGKEMVGLFTKVGGLRQATKQTEKT